MTSQYVPEPSALQKARISAAISLFVPTIAVIAMVTPGRRWGDIPEYFVYPWQSADALGAADAGVPSSPVFWTTLVVSALLAGIGAFKIFTAGGGAGAGAVTGTDADTGTSAGAVAGDITRASDTAGTTYAARAASLRNTVTLLGSAAALVAVVWVIPALFYNFSGLSGGSMLSWSWLLIVAVLYGLVPRYFVGRVQKAQPRSAV